MSLHATSKAMETTLPSSPTSESLVRGSAGFSLSLLAARRPLTRGDRDPFTNHCLSTTAVCPYLSRSINRQRTFVSEYRIGGGTIADLQAAVFYAAIPAVEAFRDSTRATDRDSGLQCENVAFMIADPGMAANGRDVLEWPHWMLKLLYTKAGLVFGKFWKGETLISRSGLAAPVPERNFLSIRWALRGRDDHFFESTPFLQRQFENASYDRRNVHEDFGVSRRDAYSVQTLMERNYFDLVRAWAESLTAELDVSGPLGRARST